MRRALLGVLLAALAPACDQAKHGCTGDVVQCADVGLEQCLLQDLCSLSGTCSGGVTTSCTAPKTEAACEALGGCSWGAMCTGTARQCSTYSQSECSSHGGCYWNYGTCDGYVQDCNSTPMVVCAQHEGCVPGGECFGSDSCDQIQIMECAKRAGCTAKPDCSGYTSGCSSFSSAQACAQQAGCHWE